MIMYNLLFYDENYIFLPLFLVSCRVETERQVSMISITLSTKELNKNSPGYFYSFSVNLSNYIRSLDFSSFLPGCC